MNIKFVLYYVGMGIDKMMDLDYNIQRNDDIKNSTTRYCGVFDEKIRMGVYNDHQNTQKRRQRSTF